MKIAIYNYDNSIVLGYKTIDSIKGILLSRYAISELVYMLDYYMDFNPDDEIFKEINIETFMVSEHVDDNIKEMIKNIFHV